MAVLFLGLAIYFALVPQQTGGVDKVAVAEKSVVKETDAKAQDLLRSLLLRGQQWTGKVSFNVKKEQTKEPSFSSIFFAQKDGKKRYDFALRLDGQEETVSVILSDNKKYSCSQQECKLGTDETLPSGILEFPLTLEQLQRVNVQKSKSKEIAGKKSYCFNIDAQTACWTEDGAPALVEQITSSEGKITIEATSIDSDVQTEYFNLPGRLQ